MSPSVIVSPVALAPSFIILLGGCTAIAAHSSGVTPAAAAAVALLVACAWIFAGSQHFVPLWPPAVILTLSLTLLVCLVSLYRLEDEALLPSQISVEAKILLNREWGKSRALLLDTPYGRLAAYLPAEQAPQAGATVRIRGAVFDWKRAERVGGFDEYLFWRAKGAAKKIILLECVTTRKPEGMYVWRNFLERRINETLPGRSAEYLLALTLGTRTAALSDLHKSAGTLHILAVSGFHVGILFWLVSRVLRRGAAKLLGISAIVWFYILFAGAPPGGVRAAVMLQIYLLSGFLGRPASAFNSVSLAGAAMLVYNPWFFFDIGWRLTMLAALFLSAFGPVAGRSRMAAPVAGVLVWIVTAPAAAAAFGEIPLAGLFVNSVAVPFFSCIFPLIFLFALPALAGFSHFVPVGVCEYILTGWEIFSRVFVRFVPWSIQYTALLYLLAAFVFSAAVLRASGFSKTKIVTGAFILPITLLLLPRLL